MNGAERIAAERARHQAEWSSDHDDSHKHGELACAAVSYAAPRRVYAENRFAKGVSFEDPWPWGPSAPHQKSRIRELEKAGALIAAEIDRLLRQEAGES